MRYSIDTSSLITSWHTLYPPAIFASLWARIEQFIEAGELKMCQPAYDELQAQNDDLAIWAQQREGDLLIPLDTDIQTCVLQIMAAHPTLTDPAALRGGSGADPFVIAVAENHSAIVVTEEKIVGPGARRVKIPNVCQARGVACSKFLDMVRAEAWQF